MTSSSLWQDFEALSHDDGGGTLSALQLPGSGSHFLAKGKAGEPVLLLKSLKRRFPRIPLGLRHVQVDFEVSCTVRDSEVKDDSALVVGTFCRASCDPTAPNLHPLFVHALTGAAEELPAELTSEDADAFFDNAVELFRALSLPPRNSVLGLWGELFVISISPNPEFLIKGWHTSTEQRFDFTFPNCFLEVKATVRDNRQHEFSLGQLRRDTPIAIASLIVEASDVGDNVFDLASSFQGSLSPINRTKLWRLVAESVGGDADQMADIRYLRTAASNSLRFYDAKSLPAPEIPIAAQTCISSVNFSMDLDLAPSPIYLSDSEVWGLLAHVE